MNNAYIVDAIRTPIGRYGGALSAVRADDLAAAPIRALIERQTALDWAAVEDIFYGCANQAGEDNRNVARMAGLLAGLPETVPGVTLNRLCGSGMDAVGSAARAIKAGEMELAIAGGVESMSRAPMVLAKADSAFSRNAEIYDTTIGWRFINKLLQQQYGTDSMPETAENVAEQFDIDRQSQDSFAARSHALAAAARDSGRLAEEIVAVTIPQRKGEPRVVEHDEHIRPETSVESLARLGTPFRRDGTVTAGNASGVNDGACALLLASESALHSHSLTPMARVVTMATVGLAPRIMGFGPAPAARKALAQAGLSLAQMDVIEFNEAFAAQALAVSRDLGIADDDPRLNPNGGAIALGHPLGMSGARLVTTAAYQLRNSGGRYALCAMCIGVGQGIAVIIERL
ncbi:3-oxoadipyl-CoA thiolase [Gammaproteobacteria bacterium LSUCC0057]|uniref:Beta-ketoadipyl-CoA thiolase n=1 Tax=Gammaproteobacteria bacterium LSUCC0057 TaxID=2559237 RepID=A0A4Y8UN38_9GAMM|nr:3-oxoadipyl-CoA thiolase [Gammaproteobacteria bacterium LSUCC0057]